MLPEDEVMEALNRMAHTLAARVFGVDLGVGESGGRLVFVDADGDPLMNDGDEVIAATKEEIANGIIPEFTVRALRAAGIAKYLEIERSRMP